jgi:LacI family transcriptional regulator
MGRRITINDIARRAGVSSQTVSRVLNNKPDVAEETRRRIESVIAELDYRPSELARGLRSQNTRTIGLIVPDNANPFFAEIAKGVESAGFEAGYSVILCNSAQMSERELEYVNVLQAKGVDGIIFISTTTHINHIRPIVERGIPVVMFYREAGDLDVDTFKIDNEWAGYLATQHLVDLGHRDIACIMPRADELPSGRRVDGFRRALQESGLPVHDDLIVRGNNLLSGGEAAVGELLRARQPFTAIFAANDAMAIGAMRALRDNRLRVPEDVSVTGVDGILLGEYVEPPLTTVEQPKREAGEWAVRFLVERIDGRHDGGARNTLMDVQLVVRKSTLPKPRNG